MNGKGEDKLPAVIDSSEKPTPTPIVFVNEDTKPNGTYNRNDYVDLCTRIKRLNNCEVKLDVYSRGLAFIVTRFGSKEKESITFQTNNVSGEKVASYILDPTIFTIFNTKISKIMEELAIVKFYIAQKSTDASSQVFLIDIPVGVSGNLRIFFSLSE
jgi:hypothetical protein